MFERPRAGERAVLVRFGLGVPVRPEDLEEFEQLARSAGGWPGATVTPRRARARPVLVRFGLGVPVRPEDLEEFEQLARSAGAYPVATITGRRSRPDARYFVGSGKADEIAAAARAENAELILFDHPLSPSQQRN